MRGGRTRRVWTPGERGPSKMHAKQCLVTGDLQPMDPERLLMVARAKGIAVTTTGPRSGKEKNRPLVDVAADLGYPWCLRFDSTREAMRYIHLRKREIASEIHGLQRQVRFPIMVSNPRGEAVHVADYVADAVYVDSVTFRQVVEDVKGMAGLPVYRLKKKLVEALYGIAITEVR